MQVSCFSRRTHKYFSCFYEVNSFYGSSLFKNTKNENELKERNLITVYTHVKIETFRKRTR